MCRFSLLLGRGHLRLLAAAHPARADFGVQIHGHFVLKQRGLVVRKSREQVADGLDFLVVRKRLTNCIPGLGGGWAAIGVA